jgi:hypothetical protein
MSTRCSNKPETISILAKRSRLPTQVKRNVRAPYVLRLSFSGLLGSREARTADSKITHAEVPFGGLVDKNFYKKVVLKNLFSAGYRDVYAYTSFRLLGSAQSTPIPHDTHLKRHLVPRYACITRRYLKIHLQGHFAKKKKNK